MGGDPIVKHADALYSNRQDGTQAAAALQRYAELAENPVFTYEACWKKGRAAWFLGEFHPSYKQDGMYKSAMNACRKAIDINPQGAEGYLWYGSTMGLYAQERGVMKSLFMVGDIIKSLTRSIELNPNVEGGAAYRAMGRVYYAIPSFVGGSNEESLKYLEKALAIAHHPNTYMCLADTYLAMKKYTNAKEILERLVSFECETEWLPEAIANKKKAELKLQVI